MATAGSDAASGQGKENVVDENEVRQESSKAAEQAQKAQKKANDLREAAHGAADADERQKLLEQAIDKEIEAESFGKTAKYLRTGTFQGMAAGTGLGVVPGATLGTITGTLVGGLTSIITGGLGAAGGALAGAVHGPFWNLGKVAGKQIQKVTGNLPSWKATEPQKKRLEYMMGQIKEEDMPTGDELEYMKRDNGTEEGTSWAQSVTSAMSYVPDWMKGGPAKAESNSSGDQEQKAQPPQSRSKSKPGAQTNPAESGSPSNTPTQKRVGGAANGRKPSARPAPQGKQPKSGATQDGKPRTKQVQFEQPQERKQPRKLEPRSSKQPQASKPATANASTTNAKKPRKLERRSVDGGVA